MNKKEQLKSDLEKITKSIVTFLQSFEFCYYLNYPKSENQLDEKHLKYITNSGFFSFSRYALWRVTILELHKLTNDNKETDKYNLHHLLRKLGKGGIYQSLEVNKTKVNEWKSALNKQKESIDQVGKLRFKLYAHTDGNYKNVIDNSELTLKATEELINDIVKIIFEIYLIIFDTHFDLKPIHDRKVVRRIIEDILTKRELDRKNIVENFIKNANNKNYS